jgi:hypothetical protein
MGSEAFTELLIAERHIKKIQKKVLKCTRNRLGRSARQNVPISMASLHTLQHSKFLMNCTGISKDNPS